MKLMNYFKGIAVELRHVVWPTPRETTILTIIVVIVSLAAGYYLGLFDLIFGRILELAL